MRTKDSRTVLRGLGRSNAPRLPGGLARDDSLRLQAEGFWNDTGVSSYTVRSVHAHRRALLHPCVSHGTLAHWYASVFTDGGDLP